MYTVMIGDDGMFSAEYVVPAALSIPLGTSGSAVDVVRNEDGTFSANGEVITAETMVTAANGNVYAAVLSPEGVPVGVMHVAAMQDVMLGALGGTVQLTQAEDKSWWLGEMAVMDGYVHTHENGNMYTLMMDAEGMWSAMYQKVEVMVGLGTQGSITLERAEDMSWWLASEAVDVGSEVMSDSGNTYTLWYADGVWSTRFEPESMMIEGTGLVAMTKEDRSGYDVDGADLPTALPAEGTEIDTSMGSYRVTMMDGKLSGVRYDGAPVGDTVYVTVGLYNNKLSRDAQVTHIADDRDTDFNEANTKVKVAGEDISLGALLGPGSAMKAAAASDGLAGEFVNSAVDLLRDLLTEAELYAKYQAALPDNAKAADRRAFDARLNSIADRAQEAVSMIFGKNIGPSAEDEDIIVVKAEHKVDIIDHALPMRDTSNDNDTTTDYIRATQTVRGLNRLLDALSSADAFVAATKDGNNGVFEDALGEDAARDAFSANKSEYMVYFGTTENTRYGAIALKKRASAEYSPDGTGTDQAEVDDAAVYGMRFQYDGDFTGTSDDPDKVEVGKVGAFSYATVNDTLRSRNLLQTGGAAYTGGTVAATPAGKLYSGDMQVDVNFRQQSVFGRVSNLKDKDNNLWKYLDGDVDTIYLPRQNYTSNTQFGGVHNGSEDLRRGGTRAFKTATVVYSQSQGFATNPTQQQTEARFAGRFIGSDGAEITGTWSLGQPQGGNATEKSNDLDVIFGSYGVTRQGSSDLVGPADGTAGGMVKTTAVLPVSDDEADPPILGVEFVGDKDAAGILRLGKRSTGGGKDTNNDFLLTDIFVQPGANPKTKTNNSPTHVSVVVDHIEAQRAIYQIYSEQVGGDSKDLTELANVGRQNAWNSINKFVRDHIFDLTELAPNGFTDGIANPVVAVAEVEDWEDLSSPLGSFLYPMTRNETPDDAAALEQIDKLLAAFADQYAFADALKPHGGGVFDSQPAMSSGEDVANPFPLDVVDDVDADEYKPHALADIFKRITSQTKLTSLSTAYTRFGVWYRRETASAVHHWGQNTGNGQDRGHHESPVDGDGDDTGSTSPGSYAYSYLSQSSYRVDRAVATYPSNGLATYEGKTLVNTVHNRAYVGDALIRVNWDATTDDASSTQVSSTIFPIFSNFERVDDDSLDRLTHGGELGNNRIVDEIAFRNSEGGPLPLMHDGDDGKLGFDATGALVEVVYTDGTSIGTNSLSATFNGKFVGSSGDGPLGVLGTWKVPDFNGTETPDPNNDLIGSFGADLTSFETALPQP